MAKGALGIQKPRLLRHCILAVAIYGSYIAANVAASSMVHAK